MLYTVCERKVAIVKGNILSAHGQWRCIFLDYVCENDVHLVKVLDEEFYKAKSEVKKERDKGIIEKKERKQGEK